MDTGSRFNVTLASDAPISIVRYIILPTLPHILDCHAILSIVSFPNLLIPRAPRPNHVFTTSNIKGHPGEAKICAFGRWKAWLRVELGAGTVCFVLTGSSNSAVSQMEFEDDKLMSRVFGLGLLCTSLPTRLAQFSYCIGNVLDPNYIYNELVLDDIA
ncbi:hypothetical protein SCA6_011868 [Theobroma cacao]